MSAITPDLLIISNARGNSPCLNLNNIYFFISLYYTFKILKMLLLFNNRIIERKKKPHAILNAVHVICMRTRIRFVLNVKTIKTIKVQVSEERFFFLALQSKCL